MNRTLLVLSTAIAPALWGTTYLVTTELLPPGRPLTAALLRALPAGLLLLLLTHLLAWRRPGNRRVPADRSPSVPTGTAVRRAVPGTASSGGPMLPQGIWWLRVAVLGTLNIGAFFALLFVAAYRLPGGVAATLGAVQPLVVLGLAAMLLAPPRHSWRVPLHHAPSGTVGHRAHHPGTVGHRAHHPGTVGHRAHHPGTVGHRAHQAGTVGHGAIPVMRVVAGLVGVAGVGLMVLTGQARLDAVGVAAGLAGTVGMATGTVLSKRWGRPVPLLVFTGWQLVAGGLVLLPVALAVEGLPRGIDGPALLGHLWLGLLGTSLAYVLWFRGVDGLPAPAVTFLALLSPVVATLAGWLVAGQDLTGAQVAGFGLALVALVAGQWPGGTGRATRKDGTPSEVTEPEETARVVVEKVVA